MRIYICDCGRGGKKIGIERSWIVPIKGDEQCQFCGRYAREERVPDTWTPEMGLNNETKLELKIRPVYN